MTAQPPVRVLITGSRSWPSYRAVAAVLDQLRDRYGDLVVVHGACPQGADAMAAAWCRRHGVRQESYPADWRRYGRRAGPIRNAAMVDAGADLCLAFIAHNSRGTRHCAALAERAGIRTRRYWWPPRCGQ